MAIMTHDLPAQEPNMNTCTVNESNASDAAIQKQVATVIFRPPGNKNDLRVSLPESVLPVCGKCKKDFKSRKTCRILYGHTHPPWTRSFICVMLDDSSVSIPESSEERLTLIDDMLEVKEVHYNLDYHNKFIVGFAFDPDVPYCFACKLTNRSRYACRSKDHHTMLPWNTVFVTVGCANSLSQPNEAPSATSITVADHSEDIQNVQPSKAFLIEFSHLSISLKWLIRKETTAFVSSQLTSFFSKTANTSQQTKIKVVNKFSIKPSNKRNGFLSGSDTAAANRHCLHQMQEQTGRTCSPLNNTTLASTPFYGRFISQVHPSYHDTARVNRSYRDMSYRSMDLVGSLVPNSDGLMIQSDADRNRILEYNRLPPSSISPEWLQQNEHTTDRRAIELLGILRRNRESESLSNRSIASTISLNNTDSTPLWGTNSVHPALSVQELQRMQYILDQERIAYLRIQRQRQEILDQQIHLHIRNQRFLQNAQDFVPQSSQSQPHLPTSREQLLQRSVQSLSYTSPGKLITRAAENVSFDGGSHNWNVLDRRQQFCAENTQLLKAAQLLRKGHQSFHDAVKAECNK